MDIKIGVENSSRELSLEVEASAEDIRMELIKALLDNGVFELEDAKGRKVIIPAAKISYVDLGAEQTTRVGFAV